MIESFKLPVITPETLTGSIVSFNDEYGNLPLKSCTSLISGYQEGSGTPSPDNVRPLHAWSSANLFDTGKNLFDKNSSAMIFDGYLGSGNKIIGASGFKTGFIKCKPNTTYTVSKIPTKRFYVAYTYDYPMNGGTYYGSKSQTSDTQTSLTITTNSQAVYLLTFFYNPTIETASLSDILDSLQIEENVDATTYEPFGNTYTFTFGQSIYIGYIDWDRGVVTLIVKSFSFNSALYYGTYGDDNSNLYYVEIPNYTTEVVKSMARSYEEGVLVSNLFTKTTSTLAPSMFNNEIRTNADATPSRFYFRADSFTDLTAFNNFLNTTPLQVMAELATPIEIPLGGIQLLTQEGQNNIFADCGSTSVTHLKVT